MSALKNTKEGYLGLESCARNAMLCNKAIHVRSYHTWGGEEKIQGIAAPRQMHLKEISALKLDPVLLFCFFVEFKDHNTI